MAPALICAGNDISLDCLAFAGPIRRGSGPHHQTPPLPSATNEKDISPATRRSPVLSAVTSPRIRRPLFFFFWQVLMRQGWLPSRPGAGNGRDGPFLFFFFCHSITWLAAWGDSILPASLLPHPPVLHFGTLAIYISDSNIFFVVFWIFYWILNFKAPLLCYIQSVSMNNAMRKEVCA